MSALQVESSLQEGKYIIKKILGQGGFGISYLAEHTLLGTKVAIKEFFFKQYCDRDETSSQVSLGTQSAHEEVLRYQDKFLKEARIIAKLNHPNIVKVHDIFKENNTAYYVMDYVEGETLSELIKRRGTLPESEAVEYIHQAGDALAYLHEQHLNHLDVKPGNLMLRESDNKVILIDFGMSKQYDTVSGNQTSTTPVGISHGYAPLEQYKEGGVKEFSPETDIYALGATLYKLLTGITPPQATDIVSEGWEPEYPTGISSNVKAAIAKAMEIRKNGRFHTINEFMETLGIDSNTSGPASIATDQPALPLTNQNTGAEDSAKDEETKLFDRECDEEDLPYVDLGLSVKWARCNLGATSPSEIGSYYAWGETKPKTRFYRKEYSLYVDGNEGMKNAHGEECDAARQMLGKEWRIPTKSEAEELFSNCDLEWTELNGMKGCTFRSKINGNRIFFPATGTYTDEKLYSKGSGGYFWTATQCLEEDMRATTFFVSPRNNKCGTTWRECGLAIRPVYSGVWDDRVLFQPKVKQKNKSQYTFGWKKSGPRLVFFFYATNVFIFLLITIITGFWILGAFGVSASSLILRRYCYRNKEV